MLLSGYVGRIIFKYLSITDTLKIYTSHNILF